GPECHRVLPATPSAAVELPAAHRAEPVLDRSQEARRDAAPPRIGMGRDVIQPAATAVESGERGRDDAIALNTNDAQSLVALRHRCARCVLLSRLISRAPRAPVRAMRAAIALMIPASPH